MYQVCRWSDGSVVFRGTFSECKAYVSAAWYVSHDITDFMISKEVI